MSKVFTALSVSVDGCITGRNPGIGRGHHVGLGLLEAVPAPGVTHLKYEVLR